MRRRGEGHSGEEAHTTRSSLWLYKSLSLDMDSADIALSLADTLAMPSAATKRRAASQRGAAGSSVSDLIMKAASVADANAGVSLASLKKALKVGGYDVDTDRARIINALKRLVAKNDLVQVKGTGAASGSFKVNKNLPKPPRTKGAQKKKTQGIRVQQARVRKAAVNATAVARKKTAKRPREARKPKSGHPVTRSLRSANKK